jgi:hypothetical protein
MSDLNDDCWVNLHDFAMMSVDWLRNCSVTPVTPASLS